VDRWVLAEASATDSAEILQPAPAANESSATRLAAARQLLEILKALPLDPATSETASHPTTADGQEAVRKLLDAAAGEIDGAAALALETAHAAHDASAAAAEAEQLQKCVYSAPNSSLSGYIAIPEGKPTSDWPASMSGIPSTRLNPLSAPRLSHV
jgi:hypothetical protein